jgi:hypothetical protein
MRPDLTVAPDALSEFLRAEEGATSGANSLIPFIGSTEMAAHREDYWLNAIPLEDGEGGRGEVLVSIIECDQHSSAGYGTSVYELQELVGTNELITKPAQRSELTFEDMRGSAVRTEHGISRDFRNRVVTQHAHTARLSDSRTESARQTPRRETKSHIQFWPTAQGTVSSPFFEHEWTVCRPEPTDICAHSRVIVGKEMKYR